MKILQLTQRLPPAPGGVEEHVLQISKRLAKKGHKVIIFISDLEREISHLPACHMGRNPYFSWRGVTIEATGLDEGMSCNCFRGDSEPIGFMG